MNIYLVETSFLGYDTYDSFVVIEASEDKARDAHPMCCWDNLSDSAAHWSDQQGVWVPLCNKHKLRVRLLGVSVSAKPEIIMASFNAG